MVEPNDALVECFKRLTKIQKEKIRFHLRRKTPVVTSTSIWTDGQGGA